MKPLAALFLFLSFVGCNSGGGIQPSPSPSPSPSMSASASPSPSPSVSPSPSMSVSPSPSPSDSPSPSPSPSISMSPSPSPSPSMSVSPSPSPSPSTQSQWNVVLWTAADTDDTAGALNALKHGADPNWVGSDGASQVKIEPIVAASANCFFDMVQLLATHGAIIDQSNNELMKTALLAAAWRNCDVQIDTYLLGLGAKVNHQAHNGFTALHDSALRGGVANSELLVDAGTDLTLLNQDNNTPLGSAQNGLKNRAGKVDDNGIPYGSVQDYQTIIAYIQAHGGK